jgi:hypothetical protein
MDHDSAATRRRFTADRIVVGLLVATTLAVWVFPPCSVAQPGDVYADDDKTNVIAVELRDDSGVVPDSSDRARGRLALLPIIFSSPDTRFAFGVLPQYIFRLAPDSRPSSLRADAYYTLNKQYSVQLSPDVWLANDRYRIGGKIVFRDWPTSYYGIGGSREMASDSLDHESFTERLFGVSAEVQRRLFPGLFVGLSYAVRHGRIKDLSPGGELASGRVTGSGTGTASGIGLILTWDTRDHIYFPTSGSLHRTSAAVFDAILGSDYGFGGFEIDLRRYVPLALRHVVALKLEGSFRSGAPPFRMLPGLGESLRGYNTTRHIDRHRASIQVEYRFVPVWWRLGFVVFAGVGDTASRIQDLGRRQPKYAFGFGIRGVAFEGEMITVRFVFGFGQASSGDYLDLNEAY